MSLITVDVSESAANEDNSFLVGIGEMLDDLVASLPTSNVVRLSREAWILGRDR